MSRWERTTSPAEWLNLIEVEGPFVAPSVLGDAYPQGLAAPSSETRRKLRSAYAVWQESEDGGSDPLHPAWLRFVLHELLGYDDRTLAWSRREDDTIPGGDEPWVSIVDPARGGEPILPVFAHARGVSLTTPGDDAHAGSPIERAMDHCKATGARACLVTNGERWSLVHRSADGVGGVASWYAWSWGPEPDALASFVTLLGVRGIFAREGATLFDLLDRSLDLEEEVSDKLGEQVLQAVEVLVQAIDRVDRTRGGELLNGLPPKEVYEAALTVMMRLVFLLAAEGRGLLPLGDPIYDSNYAVSTMRGELRERADRFGEGVLERGYSAWVRLLATSRAVHAGIEHPRLRLAGLGGTLFDPDRYPFLEGRRRGTSWRDERAQPLPIDDRIVLLLLESIQVVRGPGGARVISFEGLDVEQIGYVYEGLLEHTVERVSEPVLGLRGSSSSRWPTIGLSELEGARKRGEAALLGLLEERTGRSRNALRRALREEPGEEARARLHVACEGDEALLELVLPFHALLRDDVWGKPLVHLPGSVAVVGGLDRRESGSHYTPKALTERIVEETLRPVVYEGVAEGRPQEEWRVRPAEEILDLKVCDPAMGSGAFLVQATRYLSDRLVEAWSEAGAGPDVPADAEERALHAKRLVVERCLYGVDVNPLAVELAKLSLWLVTMSKGRPLEFLDHNLRHGDSLLGLRDLDQLLQLDLEPDGATPPPLFGQAVRDAVRRAMDKRRQIRVMELRDLVDVDHAARLNEGARRDLDRPKRVADALVGAALRSAGNDRRYSEERAVLMELVDGFVEGDEVARRRLEELAREGLSADLPAGKPPRRPFHWPLEFPEVFQRENGGFDAIVGNPPFMGGQRISGAFGGAYREYLVRWLAEGTKGSADLVAYFFLRAFDLLRQGGDFGLLAVNTIAEGDTRQVGLERLVGEKGAVIYAAYPNEPWPGKAAVVTSRVHVRKGEWHGPATLSGRRVPFVSAFLSDQEEWTPKRLKANAGKSFQGSIVLGMGFVLSEEEALAMIKRDPKNRDVLFPYLNGKDLNDHPEQRPSRWVVNFWDWPEEKAREYEEPYRIVLERVKPQRDRLNTRTSTGRRRKTYWWLYGSDAKSLYHTIGRGHAFVWHPRDWDPNTKPMERVLATTRVSKTGALVLVENDAVFSDATVVFAMDGYSDFALLQSSIHAAFAWKHSSQLKTDMRYTPTDVFEPFPFPKNGDSLTLRRLGERYHTLRAEIMRDEWIGLTKLYNRFHDPDGHDPRIQQLRDLHRQIDEAVAEAYGWDDLDLEHDFHEVAYLPKNDRVRFTISEGARLEVLRRLAHLNEERYEEEVRQGLHGPGSTPRSKKWSKPKGRGEKKAGLARAVVPQPPLFDTSEMEIDTGRRRWRARSSTSRAKEAVVAHLHGSPGWHTKSDVLAATGISTSEWNRTIKELLSEGVVIKEGDRRGARYRLATEEEG